MRHSTAEADSVTCQNPNSLSNGPQKCFLGFYLLLPAVLGILFHPGYSAWEIQSALGRHLACLRTVSLLHDFSGTLFFFFCFFFLSGSQTLVIFSHMCIATVKQSEFLPRPRLWITDCVKSRCGRKIANRRRRDAACLTRAQNRPVCFCMVPRTHVFDIRDTCTDRPEDLAGPNKGYRPHLY